MKILQCINTLCSGGAEIFACSLAIAQKRKGHDIYFFSYAGAIDEKGRQLESLLKQAGVNYITPSIKKNWMKPLVPFILARQLLALRPDVVHSHLEQSDFFTWLAAKLTISASVMIRTIHSVYVPKVLPPFIHRQLAQFYGSVACAEVVKEMYPFLGSRSGIINNGMDLAPLTHMPSRSQARAALGIKEKVTMLLNVGSFNTRNAQLPKGQDIIIRALSHLKTENVTAVFLGDGDSRNEIETLATTCDVLQKCIFAGKVTNPIEYICAADVVLMPSRFEGMSISCIEAVCTGLPIVVSDIPAFMPFRRASTIVVKNDSPLSLTNGINTFLNDRDRYQRTAKKEQTSYQEEFSIEAVATRYLDFYRMTAMHMGKSQSATATHKE